MVSGRLRQREGAFQPILILSHHSRENPRTPNGPPWLGIKVVLLQMTSTKPMEGESNMTQSLAGSPTIPTHGMKTIRNHNSYRTLPLSTNGTIAKPSQLCERAGRLPPPKQTKNTYQYWSRKPHPRATPTSPHLLRTHESGREMITRRQQVEIRDRRI